MPAIALDRDEAVGNDRPATCPFRIGLLGRFTLLRQGDSNVIALPLYAQRLLAFLALASGRRDRGEVASMLWLDTPDRRAAANLRTTLWKLRQVSAELVVADPRSARLGESVAVDYDEAVAGARGLAGPLCDGDESIPAAWYTFDDELLPGWYDDWVIAERERF